MNSFASGNDSVADVNTCYPHSTSELIMIILFNTRSTLQGLQPPQLTDVGATSLTVNILAPSQPNGDILSYTIIRNGSEVRDLQGLLSVVRFDHQRIDSVIKNSCRDYIQL